MEQLVVIVNFTKAMELVVTEEASYVNSVPAR